MNDYSNKFWKTATIFISSTFMDMNCERDILNNYVLPKLNENLNPKRINAQFIDLRWGIRTGESVNEEESDNKVLSVCFTEIARSQPFFVALLGDRYGYDKLDKAILDSNAFRFNSAIDNQNLYNKSVTELEIMYGVFSHPEYQIPKALFFFRQANYAGMSNDTKEKFTEGKSKIDYLKKLISDKCSENKCRDNVICYHVSDWDESERRFRSFNNTDLGDLIYLHLYKKILEHFESQDVSKMKLPEQLRFEQESFLYNTGNAIGVEERIEALLSNSRLLNIIRGESGIGKTTLLKHLAKYLNNKGSKRLVLYYNAALSAKHREIKNMMLCCMCQMLKDSNELYHDIENRSEEEVLDILEKELVIYKSQNYEIYFVIDSYESLYNCSIAKNLPFLRYATKSFVSIQNETKIHFQKDVDSQILSLRGLNIEEAETMMKDLFKAYHKEWNIELWSNIRNKFDSVINPLWIELAVNILSSLSAPDFNKIETTKSSTVSGGEALERYLNSLVKEFPDKVGPLFGYYLNKLFEDNDLPFSNQFMLWCISLSRNGIRENDLAALTNQAGSWDSLQFARLRYLFHSCIIERGTENCWGFSHNVYGCVIRDSINEFSKLTNTDFVINLHKGLGHHYVHCDSHYDLRESECMYHLVHGNDKETAAKYLLNSDALKNDSKDFVHSISDVTDYIIENKDYNIKYCRIPKGMPIPEISTFRNTAIDWLLNLTNIETLRSDVARLIKIFAIDVTNELFMRGEIDSVIILNIKLISETPKIANYDERLGIEKLIQINCSKAQRLSGRGNYLNDDNKTEASTAIFSTHSKNNHKMEAIKCFIDQFESAQQEMFRGNFENVISKINIFLNEISSYENIIPPEILVEGKTKALLCLADSYLRTGNEDQALFLYNELDELIDVEEPRWQLLQKRILQIYFNKQDSKCLSIASKYLSVAEKHFYADRTNCLNCENLLQSLVLYCRALYISKADSNTIEKNIDRTKRFYSQIQDDYRDNKQIIQTYSYLLEFEGEYYQELEQVVDAEKSLKARLDICEFLSGIDPSDFDTLRDYAKSNEDIGYFYLSNESYEKAKEYITDAIIIISKWNDSKEKQYRLANMYLAEGVVMKEIKKNDVLKCVNNRKKEIMTFAFLTNEDKQSYINELDKVINTLTN